MAGFDPETQTIVSLYNPRTSAWSEHFIWSMDGKRIIGITPVGRSTCQRLDLNDTGYPEEDSIQSARSFWVKAGLHPPETDPRQIEYNS